MEIKDFYSHPHLIKTKFPTPETLPEVIKTAKIVPKSNLNALPDHAFALVTQENGDKIRKFACYDKASTILSTIFLLDYNPELPENLKKVAAINLKKACTFYDIVPPDPLIKLAGEISNEDNPEFVKSAGLTAKKADEIVGKMTQILLETKEKTESEVEKKGAYCLPEQKKYPLHSYRQTMAAIDYFQKYATRFDPQTRRTYAKNLEKRASELAIALPDIIKKYASETPAPVTEVYEGLSRRMHLRPDMANAYEKLASKIEEIKRDVFANALLEIDKTAGLHLQWDESIKDPFYTCFTIEKTATYTFNDSTGYITEYDLNKLTQFPDQIEQALGKDIAEGFKKDPVGVFESLPLPEKRVIIRLAVTRRSA